MSENRHAELGSWELIDIELSLNSSSFFESRFERSKFVIMIATQKVNLITIMFVNGHYDTQRISDAPFT